MRVPTRYNKNRLIYKKIILYLKWDYPTMHLFFTAEAKAVGVTLSNIPHNLMIKINLYFFSESMSVLTAIKIRNKNNNILIIKTFIAV